MLKSDIFELAFVSQQHVTPSFITKARCILQLIKPGG
jgi:hypothetical protein